MKRARGRIGYRIGKLSVKSHELQHRVHESICVADLTYDIESQQVTCQFQERGTYVYYDVPPEVFAEWNTSGSRGTYFNLYIRPQYQSERIN